MRMRAGGVVVVWAALIFATDTAAGQHRRCGLAGHRVRGVG